MLHMLHCGHLNSLMKLSRLSLHYLKTNTRVTRLTHAGHCALAFFLQQGPVLPLVLMERPVQIEARAHPARLLGRVDILLEVARGVMQFGFRARRSKKCLR